MTRSSKAWIVCEGIEARTLFTADVAPYHLELFKQVGSTFSPLTTVSAGQEVWPQIAFQNGGDSNLQTSSLHFAVFASPSGDISDGTYMTDFTDTTVYDVVPGDTVASFGPFSKFKIPASLPVGDYYFVALANDNQSFQESNPTNNIITTDAPIHVVSPLEGLTPTFTPDAKFLANVLAGKKGTVAIGVNNPSATPLRASFSGQILASADQVADGGDTVLGTISGTNINLAPGKVTKFNALVSIATSLPAGDYYLVGSVTILNPITNTTVGTVQVSTPATINIPTIRSGFVDGDGTLVGLTLTAGATGGFAYNSGTGNVDLILSTTAANTIATVRTTGGDGAASLGHIAAANAVKVVNAAKVDLLNSATFSGGLGALALRNVISAGTISIGSALPAVSFKLGNVSETSISSAAPIKLLSAAAWTDVDATADVITAPSIDGLLVKGGFGAGLTLSGIGVFGHKTTLGLARIGGAIDHSAWNITGSVTDVKAGSATSWTAVVSGAFSNLLISGNADGTLSAASTKKIIVRGTNNLIIT